MTEAELDNWLKKTRTEKDDEYDQAIKTIFSKKLDIEEDEEDYKE